ncbi:hypothetical protein P167DRAFT_568647 [Morchella conica CCBAS932]|uniref:Uncharacterized protein n=1 Tax=Morchella conica CCBAS932 TaxID=1392247 RepID=A0A3N4KA33_9PEZI|nr:hypothetical protein P167DRAFT_568647 [Morchella conica CCBAS932]
MVPYKLPQGGDASARVSALAKERLKPKFAIVLFVEQNVAAAWLYRWVAVDGIEGPRKLELVGDKTFKAPTSGSGGIAWLEASLAPLAKLACANLPTRAGGVKLILLNSTAVQALPRHSTSGSYHTLCDALRACAKDIQGTRFDIEACPLIPGYEEADARKEYYHAEVLRSFFVRRALVLNNNKKDDHNMTLSLYGLELIDRTVPLGHVKLYKTQRSADVILDFEHDKNEISNLSAKQIDQFGKRQKNKDKKAVEAALKKAFNDALPWVPRLEGKVPVFFVGAVSSNEQIQRERYDAAIEMAKVYAKNWRYPGDSPPVQWEFIVAPPKDLSGETDDRVDDNEESSRERIWRYYNKYSVVVSNSKTTVYNWHDWAAGDRCLPPLEAISIWDTDSSTPNVIPDILKRARSFLPTYAGQVPVFVWHTGNTDPLPDTVEELRVVINSPPSPDGTTSFILAEFAAVPDNEIVLGAAVAQEYAIAAGTPNNSTIVNAAKARHGWWYSPTAKTYLEGRMFGVQSGGEILDVFVQRSPALVAKDIRAHPMELYDLLVPGVEGVSPEGVLVGCAASELAQVKVGEDIKCNATSVHVCAEHKDGEGVELASGRKAFEEASTALRVLSIGFGMEVGWEGMDLGMEKWTLGRMALWATLNAQNDMWQ